MGTTLPAPAAMRRRARTHDPAPARAFLGTLLDATPRALPLTAAEPRELGMRFRAADVAVHTVEVLRRDEEPIAFRVLEEHVLVDGAAVVGDGAHLDESRDAMVTMDNQVARRELQDERLARRVPARCATRASRRRGNCASRSASEHRTASLDGAEQLTVGIHVHGAVGDRKPLCQVRRRDDDRASRQPC
jgi:hypothetical protein